LLELVRLAGPEPDGRLAEALGRLTASLWALRSLSLSVATALAAGQLPNTEAAVVKDVKDLNLAEMAMDVGVPYHPGALKYYKEAGALK
ncbi:MAG: hypothetical protein HYY88_11805, partial [candidate division NC10 bacterium]|nr:hypothetical protein [candidate division NC10 bacterium]